MAFTIREVLQGWSSDHIANLCTLLEIDKTADLSVIEEKFKWLFHSKSRAGAESATKRLGAKLLSKLSDAEAPDISADSLRSLPTYTELLQDACKHMKVLEEGASLDECELYLSQAVIVAAMASMGPKERASFFDAQIEVADVIDGKHVRGTTYAGPLTTIAALGLAQASGFGVYMAATTALGFVTHAVGVTLPFAVYSGMTSTIAFVIGPAGWLTAGLWGAWLATKPKRQKIVPALLYIIAVNGRTKLG